MFGGEATGEQLTEEVRESLRHGRRSGDELHERTNVFSRNCPATTFASAVEQHRLAVHHEN